MTSAAHAVVPSLTTNALTVLKKRYLKKNLQGEPTESPADMFRRVAQVIAGAETLFNPGAAVEPLAETFYELMTNLEFLPNSPTLMNAGRELGQLSACFVLPVGDSIDDIFDAVKFTALIHKSGGGCIAGDARVWTTFCGVEPIEVLFARATADGREGARDGAGTAYDVRDLGIRTVSMDPTDGKTGLRPVTHVWRFDVPAENQLVVTTREGTLVQTSDWHPFMVLRGTRLTEVRADELHSGDILLGPERPDAFWPWDETRTVGSLTIDIDLGWLIGFTLGDGSFGYSPALRQRRTRWYSGTADVLERVRAVLAGRDIHVKIHRDRRNLLQVVTANQRFVQDLLEACGLQEPGPKDDRIRVPEIISKSPLNVVRAFVAGLLDSDGYVASDGSPSYTTVSRDMAEDLAALMSLLGYQPTVKAKAPHGSGRRTTYTVQLCPLPQVNDLADDLAAHLVKTLRKSRLHSDSRKQNALAMPFAVWRDALADLGLVKHRGDRAGGPGACAEELNRWSSNAAGRCRRDDLRAIAAHVEPHDAKLSFLLKRVAACGQEVESVARAADPKPFYDLSVEDWNTYAAGSRGLTMIHNTGFSFSRLRPANDVVMSTTGISSGPISFMRVFDLATETIKQGGTRRGANMGILRVDHPDILDFIRSKADLKCFNNFNISVGLTEAFMKAVEEDGEYALVNPRNHCVAGTLKAREVFCSIVHQAWATGEPGIVFLDRLNRDNPTPQVGEIESTNPCVTAETFVQTADGPRQVRDLVGRPFAAMVNGTAFASGTQGFFATGTKPVFRLRTREGHTLRLTGDHPVRRAASVTRARVVEEWVPAAQLSPGDRIVLHRHENLCWPGKYGQAEGYLLGLLVRDGTLKADKAVISAWPVRNAVNGDTTADGIAGVMRAAAAYAETLPHRADFAGWTEVAGRGEQRLALAEVRRVAESLGMAPGAKAITPALEECSSDFCRAFLRGRFDADGSVQGSTTKGVSVRLAQNDLATLEAVQRMLLRLGIASTICRDRRSAGTSILPDGRGGAAPYAVKAQHELVVSRENLAVFAERVGFHDTAKAARLTAALGGYRRTLNRERFLATVESLDPHTCETVYDVQVPGVNAFDANGLFVHNCGEQPLLPYESCNLGSINLGRLVREGRVDWARLGEVTRLAVRFLDNVIEVNNYPLPKIDEMTRSNRKIGLGVMGWADMLIALGVPYDSPEAVALAEQLMRAIREEGHKASRQLARERGAFPNFKGSIYDRPGAEPMRNATITTIAPTGTISIIANASSGIEPLFAVSYVRTVLDKNRLIEVNPAFERLARERGFYSAELMEAIAEAGTVRGMEDVPEDVQRVFATAHDITPEVHVRMQAAFQKHTDNAVSKTVNFPAEAAEADVDKVFRLAYELDCKGVTIYRDGSREDQVLSTAKRGEAPPLPGMAPPPEAPRAPVIRRRPKALRGSTYQMDTGCGPLYVTINEDEDGIFELFTTMGKAGGCAASQCEAIGRMVSLAWRSGVEAAPVIKQLVGISCHQPAGFGVEKVLSCADAVAKAIERHCGEAGADKKRALDRGACPDCGGTVEHLEGCVVCRACGYSECA